MKTIKEQSEFLYPYKANGSRLSFNNASKQDAFKDGVEFAETWISVKDELPENTSSGFSETVLTKNSFGNLMLERYDYEARSFNCIRYDALENGDGQVTHWRPITHE